MVSQQYPSAGTHESGQNAFAPQICLTQDNGMPIPARVMQLTPLDILVATDRPLRLGSRLRMVIFSDLAVQHLDVTGTVHWCRVGEDSGWKVGVFFHEPLPEELYFRLAWESREEIRYDCSWRAWFEVQGSGCPRICTIVNYSISGVGLEGEFDAASGDSFELREAACGDSRTLLSGVVNWCRIMGNRQSLLGCRVNQHAGRFLPRHFQSGSVLNPAVGELTSSQDSPENCLRMGRAADGPASDEEFLSEPDLQRFLVEQGSAVNHMTAPRRDGNRLF